ncbi:unnamed protein product, partial [Prorocentrum cordatum]
WELYGRAAASGALVPVNALVEAWGGGYGDCAEAYGRLNDELEQHHVKGLLALVPVPWTGMVPSPRQLSELVAQMGVGSSPLVALDFIFPPLRKGAVLTLATELRLAMELAPGSADLRENHHLVAMICFMEQFQHYVVFCRCLSGSDEWLFFNDLPGTGSNSGSYRLSGWSGVANACARYEACPKMLLYENPAAAREFLEGSLRGARSARTDEPAGPTSGAPR